MGSESGQIDARIRWMIRRDMPEVLEIEKQCFEFPWQEEDFIRCLRQRNCIGMVAEHKDRVIGFKIYELHKNQLHVLDLAVHPEKQMRGVGTRMVQELKGKLSEQRRNVISLEVRESNLAAQQFLRHNEFIAQAVWRDYYNETTEDAFCFQYHVNQFANATI